MDGWGKEEKGGTLSVALPIVAVAAKKGGGRLFLSFSPSLWGKGKGGIRPMRKQEFKAFCR